MARVSISVKRPDKKGEFTKPKAQHTADANAPADHKQHGSAHQGGKHNG